MKLPARQIQQQIVYTGFIAQDVEKAAKELHYDFSGVDAAKNDKDLYGLRYSEFVVPLVKAVQELSKANDAKDAALETQQKINANLQKQIDELKAMIVSKAISNVNNNFHRYLLLHWNKAFLIPSINQQLLIIPYQRNIHQQKLLLVDKTGKVLKEVNISGNGKAVLKVDASTLSSGAYSIHSLLMEN